MNSIVFYSNKIKNIHECLYIRGIVCSTSMCAIQVNKVSLKPIVCSTSMCAIQVNITCSTSMCAIQVNKVSLKHIVCSTRMCAIQVNKLGLKPTVYYTLTHIILSY